MAVSPGEPLVVIVPVRSLAAVVLGVRPAPKLKQ